MPIKNKQTSSPQLKSKPTKGQIDTFSTLIIAATLVDSPYHFKDLLRAEAIVVVAVYRLATAIVNINNKNQPKAPHQTATTQTAARDASQTSNQTPCLQQTSTQPNDRTHNQQTIIINH